MKIDLFGESENLGPVSCECSAAELDLVSDDYTLEGDVKVVLDFHESGDLVYTDGTVEVVLSTECVRCLEPFRMDIDSKFSFVVQKLRIGETVPEEAEDEEDIDEAHLIFVPHDTNSIDIAEFVHDAIFNESNGKDHA